MYVVIDTENDEIELYNDEIEVEIRLRRLEDTL